MKKLFKLFLLIVLGAIGALHFSIPRFYISTDQKIWRHGGGDPQNTLDTTLETIRDGHLGVELNFVYKEYQFLLRRKIRDEVELGSRLIGLLDELKEERFNLWIDIKPMSIFDIYNAADKLKEIFQKYHLMGKALVETKSILFSGILRMKGIPTVLWFEPKKNFSYNIIFNLFVPLHQKYFKIPVLSFDIKNKEHEFLKSYKGKKAVFTLNDHHISDYFCDNKTKVILTDFDLKKAVDMLNDCSILQE